MGALILGLLSGPARAQTRRAPVRRPVTPAAGRPAAQLQVPTGLWSGASGGAHEAPIAFSPDGLRFAVASRDVTVRGVRDARVRLTLRHGLPSGARVVSMAFSPDGQFLATADSLGVARLWRLPEGRLVWAKDGSTVAFSPDGHYLAAGQRTGQTVRLYRALDGALLQTCSLGATAPGPVAFSPTGGLLAAAGGDVRLWRRGSVDLVTNLPTGGTRITHLVFSPDGRLLATVEGRRVRLWRLEDGSLLRVLGGHRYPIRSLAFSPDSQLVATEAPGPSSARSPGELKVWRLADGKLLRNLAPHRGVQAAAFTADGRLLAYGWTGGLVRVVYNPGSWGTPTPRVATRTAGTRVAVRSSAQGLVPPRATVRRTTRTARPVRRTAPPAPQPVRPTQPSTTRIIYDPDVGSVILREAPR